MGNVIGDVKIHMRGVEEVFRSQGIVSKMEQCADKICDAANDATNELYTTEGYELPHYEVQQYKTTHGNVGFNVHARTRLGKMAQSEHSVLTQAIDAGRG